MYKSNIESVVVELIKSWLAITEVDIDKTWKEIGWLNDSLDESEFIIELEQRLNINFNKDDEFLRKYFYQVNTTVSQFIREVIIFCEDNARL